jgi:hypothetical protein
MVVKLVPHRVFEVRVFNKPKRKKVTGGWQILHIEELQNLYYLSYFTRVIKSRKM